MKTEETTAAPTTLQQHQPQVTVARKRGRRRQQSIPDQPNGLDRVFVWDLDGSLVRSDTITDSPGTLEPSVLASVTDKLGTLAKRLKELTLSFCDEHLFLSELESSDQMHIDDVPSDQLGAGCELATSVTISTNSNNTIKKTDIEDDDDDHHHNHHHHHDHHQFHHHQHQLEQVVAEPTPVAYPAHPLAIEPTAGVDGASGEAAYGSGAGILHNMSQAAPDESFHQPASSAPMHYPSDPTLWVADSTQTEGHSHSSHGHLHFAAAAAAYNYNPMQHHHHHHHDHHQHHLYHHQHGAMATSEVHHQHQLDQHPHHHHHQPQQLQHHQPAQSHHLNHGDQSLQSHNFSQPQLIHHHQQQHQPELLSNPSNHLQPHHHHHQNSNHHMDQSGLLPAESNPHDHQHQHQLEQVVAEPTAGVDGASGEAAYGSGAGILHNMSQATPDESFHQLASSAQMHYPTDPTLWVADSTQTEGHSHSSHGHLHMAAAAAAYNYNPMQHHHHHHHDHHQHQHQLQQQQQQQQQHLFHHHQPGAMASSDIHHQHHLDQHPHPHHHQPQQLQQLQQPQQPQQPQQLQQLQHHQPAQSHHLNHGDQSLQRHNFSQPQLIHHHQQQHQPELLSSPSNHLQPHHHHQNPNHHMDQSGLLPAESNPHHNHHPHDHLELHSHHHHHHQHQHHHHPQQHQHVQQHHQHHHHQLTAVGHTKLERNNNNNQIMQATEVSPPPASKIAPADTSANNNIMNETTTIATTTTTTTLKNVLNNHHKQMTHKLSMRFHRLKTVYNLNRSGYKGDAKSSDDLQEILSEIDHYTLDWRKRTTDCLRLISESPNCTNIIVTKLPLVIAFGHLVCLGLSQFFEVDQVYSASKTNKEACLKRIKKRFGATNRCSYIIVGNREDVEMSKRLDLPSWPLSRSDGHHQLSQLHTALKDGYLM